jgi:3D (Asp-Asp-Asp) domain-containing protein
MRKLLFLTALLIIPILAYTPGRKMEIVVIHKLKRTFNLVNATVYYPERRQCDSVYWLTATGFEIDTLNPLAHRIISVSKDLLKKYPYGTKLRVIGIGDLSGIYTVRDRMSSRYSNKIDILIGKMDSLYHTRSWKNVIIKKV